MMIDGVERGAFDKIKYDITEKLSGLNKSFETSLKPEKGIFGVTEIDKGGGSVERFFRDGFNNLHKEYYQDGVLTKTREKIDAKTWCTTSFDDNGSAYVKQFNERTKNGLTAKRMELIPGVEVKKANFTAQIDELGRPVVNKITDLQKMPGREALSSADFRLVASFALRAASLALEAATDFSRIAFPTAGFSSRNEESFS